MAAHPAGGGGIEAVAAEESPGGICGEDLSIEEHAYPVCIPGAELHIVGDHQDRDALPLQVHEDLCEGLFKEAVNALGRLVQQQEPGVCQQDLGQSPPLLLSAGKVVGMPVQKGRHLAQLRYVFQGFFVLGHLLQVLPEGFFNEQTLWILGKHRQTAVKKLSRLIFFHTLSKEGDFPPVGPANAGYSLEGGGFSRTVASQDGAEAPGRDLQADSPENIRAVLLVAEPELPEL